MQKVMFFTKENNNIKVKKTSMYNIIHATQQDRQWLLRRPYPSYSCDVTDFGRTHFGHYTTPTT